MSSARVPPTSSARSAPRGIARAAAFLLAAAAIAAAPASAQGDRVHLLSRFNPYVKLDSGSGGFDYNDVFGFTTSAGREVAIVGTYTGTSFVETTDPFNLVELAFITHAGSVWSDPAVNGDTVYVVNETGGGLQIIDVSDLSNIHLVKSDTSVFQTSHTIFFDASAKVIYCSGANGGMPLFDATNPTSPVLITRYTSQYVHDGSARNGVAHFAEINAGIYRTCDVSALPAIQTLDAVATPFGAAHSAEVDAWDQIVAMCDEAREAPLVLYDVSDPRNIVLRGTFTEHGNGLFHNPWWDGSIVHLAAYAEGYVAVDASDPDHPRKLGSYDTYTGKTGGYNGAWGVFSQPSGTIYLNTIEDGLWVFCLATRIEHDGLPDTDDDVGPYVVTATITPSSHGGGLLSADLYWTSDDGATVGSAPLSPTGNPDEWSASIPGHPNGSTVQYWLRATDALGTSNEPDDPSGRHVFSVGDKTRVYFTDFESGITFFHGATSGVDDWERGTPIRLGHDPQGAYSGVQAYGTDLGIGVDADGSYDPSVSTWLESPGIDLTGIHGTRLRFQRWLSVEDASKDLARILVNGIEVWRNPTNGGTQELADVEWVTFDLDVSAAADGVAGTRVRYELTTDADGQRGGWNIDDFELYTVSDCVEPEVYGTGTAGSGGYVPKIGTSGGLPHVGNPSFTVECRKILGGASGLYLVGFGRDQIPFKGVDILVELTPPVLWIPVVASGSSGVPGAGSFALTGEIPDDPALLGLVVDSQVLTFDPGGAQGLAASAGLEFVICH
jgi:choice-of-anchor B domain-containing protein